jgi:YbbR domain-containing protein
VVLVRSEAKRLLAHVDAARATVVLAGRGRDLVSIRPGRLQFTLAPTEAKLGKKQLRLTAAELRLPPNVALVSVEPEYVELRVNEASARMVAVAVPVAGRAAGGVAVVVNRPPATVRLLGPEDEVRLIAGVSTETLNLASVTQPGTVRLRVIAPDGPYSTEPESVDVSVALEREGARIFLGIPVKAIAPSGRTVEVDPVEAQIAVAGPATVIDSLKAEQIAAVIKIVGLGPGDYRLAAEIVLPPEFHLVKCEPQLFDVTVK